MLSVMATVTTGLLSPNTYGINPDQTAAKMAAQSPNLADYDRFRASTMHFGNLSDSDAEGGAYSQPKNEQPKRNKRKNFKPRCSSSAYFDNYNNFTNNNNSKNRRKATARKIVMEPSSTFSPMDLSKNDSESTSDDSDYRSNSDLAKIPNSFSIHNLSKPHVSDFQAPASRQASDMREYAVNTMRELLGIYGLTSEVAESITRQLPIAAFSSGKILDDLHLGPPKLQQSPPSQPPTPPSTPMSPRGGVEKMNHVPVVPNVTITASSNLPQKTPLNLEVKKAATSNGLSSSLQHEYTYAQVQADIKNAEEKQMQFNKLMNNSRGIFPNILHFGGIKCENDSPPPMELNPLNAMIAQSLAPTQHSSPQSLLNKTQTSVDYSKYVKKFSSASECGSAYCRDLNYREHFHCMDCNSRVFLKKEEMIRHFKWHKKRDESLQHGFMRYSPLDDCSDRYHSCTHNRKQTHYHCIKEGCDKVYISTSDVQMHANYHRKDSAIIQEGFQRFRATEECGATYCAFFGQRTTHFHCRRSGCRFTFKNKSDMEKHKSYHIKDEQLSRDGFKKFMKNEGCPYENCRFSKVCNHIHCIRPSCNYVLHSSGQLFSHKRKHERQDSELAYRKYKLAQSMMKNMQDGGSNTSFTKEYEQQLEGLNLSMFSQGSSFSNHSNTESLSERNSPMSYDEDTSAIDLSANESSYQDENPNWNNEDFWKKYCQQGYCQDNCDLANSEHYHCLVEHCEMLLTCKDSVREHARNHEQQEQITENYYTTITHENTCDSSCIYQDKDKHYHCNWDNCREVILPMDKPFRRLEHYKMHEYSRKLSLTKDPLTMTHLATSIDGMFCRKRGRPPKNRVIEVWNDYSPTGSQSLMDSPQALFTSFKLPKPSTATPCSSKDTDGNYSNDELSDSPKSIQDYSLQGFDLYHENTKCPDNLCPYLGNVHFHCNQNRCLYVTDKEDVLIMHSKDFHDNIDILDGFEFYDRNVDCRLINCPSNKINRHFHCTRPNCNYSFVQYSTMAQHNSKHQDEENIMVKAEVDVKTEPVDCEEIVNKAANLIQANEGADNKVSVVKASGTFYPLTTLPTEPQKTAEIKSTDSNDSELTGSNTLYGPELSCSRPFCKLKRKYHYHCNACNQAFSEIDRLVVHVAKHTSSKLINQSLEDNNNQQTKSEGKINVAPLETLQNPMKTESPYLTPTFDAYSHFSNFPTNLATHFALMSQQQQMQQFLPQTYAALPAQLMFQHSGLMQNPLLTPQSTFTGENLTSPLAAMAANINKRTLLDNPHDMSPEAKKARIQNSMRILKDEPVPDGYLRFRFNEDCQYQHCGYREHQTHFHCQRHDCGYSFCDKTRFVQHTARHERLDTLMGGDFQQYRANVACGRPDCTYTANLGNTQNKASHFHCLKCEFVCTDTNKVVAHRRQHQKLDSIQAAGFEKFTPSQHCRSLNCQHSGKQTHYHCLQCQYAVLGLAQMSAHKYRHMEG